MASPANTGYMKRANSFGSNGSLSGKKRTSSKDKGRPELMRGGSRDNVRNIVEKEGKTARNLVVYSVPSEQKKKTFAANRTGRNRTKQNKKPIDKKQYEKTSKNTPPKEEVKTYNDPSKEKNQSNSANDANERETKTEQYKEHLRKVIEKSSEGTKKERSSSVSSTQSQKNLRARYWSYLFDNFHRAVDEIYNTCEHDESVIECKEVIMMLDVCKRDFTLLIQRLELFSKLESSDVKPQSLAWEVRKQMSPGKCPSPTVSSRRSPSPAAVRYLNFGPTKSALPFSWADRVRGFSNSKSHDTSDHCNTPKHESGTPKSSFPSPVLEKSMEDITTSKETEEQPVEEEDEDNDGWEIVTKGRSRSKTSSISLSSPSSSQGTAKYLPPQQPQQHLKASAKNNIEEKIKPNDAVVKSLEETNSTTSKVSSAVLDEVEIESFTLEKEKTLVAEEMNSPRFLKYNKSCETSEVEDDFVDDFDKELIHISTKKLKESYVALDYSFSLSEDDDNDDLNLQIKEEQEKALASAIAEEETLTKELEDEALKDDDNDDVSSDRDYSATDDGRDTPKDLMDDLPLDSSASLEDFDRPITWEEMCQQYDKERGMGINWADMMEVETVRMPGRALEMHQKLSSMSRKKSRSESLKRSEEKMAKAERRRLKALTEKLSRLRALSEKVRNVRELKNKLINEKEKTMQEQLKKAEIKRKSFLQEKIRKAQEEEAKVNEIAFINSLEAQNRKIEVQEKHQISEARLQELVEERQRRKDDKLAKEEAAQGRRRALEEERLARLQEIKTKRGDQAAKWQKERQEREKAREEQAKERQREREMKVAARNEALQQAAEELQKKIEQKHIESTRRHEQRIEEVKEKSRAASSSRHATVEETPSCLPYDKVKKCTLCDVEIASDVYMVSHLKGKIHRQAVREINKKITDAEIEGFSSKYIKDVDPNCAKKQKEEDDKAKAMKKRAKKIKARMSSKAKEFEPNAFSNLKPGDSQKRGRFQRAIKDIIKALQAHCNGPWPSNKITALDKSLNEICRALENKNPNDQLVFCHLGGLAVLARVLLLWDTSNLETPSKSQRIPPKIIKRTLDAIYNACADQPVNCQYMLFGNKLAILIDLLAYRLKGIDAASNEKCDEESASSPEESSQNSKKFTYVNYFSKLQEDDELTFSIVKTIETIFNSFTPSSKLKPLHGTSQDVQQRISDIVSYITCIGIFDKLVILYKSIRGPLEDLAMANILIILIAMHDAIISSVIKLDSIFLKKKEDVSMISQTILSTEVYGLITMMYSVLHPGSPTRISPSPLPLAESTVNILVHVFKTLNNLALVDVFGLQKMIGSEGVSLQFLSVVSYVLRYTSNEKCDDLLHEVILSIGYFTVLHPENQMSLQSSRGPTLIQQLCTLPFSYFSDLRLKAILFPTLICTSFNSMENKKIISQEVSPTLLSLHIEEFMKTSNDPKQQIKSIDDRSHMNFRFPKTNLEEAKKFFAENEQEN